jgi:signal transduction histidine kinase
MIWYSLRRHPALVDAGLVALLLAGTVLAATRHRYSVAGIPLGVVQTLPLLWRRRSPLVVTAVVAAIALTTVSLGLWLLPFQLGVALYTLAASASDLQAARVAGAVSVGSLAIAFAAAGSTRFGDIAFHGVFLIAAWLLGEGVRSRRAYIREIEEKAERLEREREAEAGRAVAEEQARIGRELHDVVAHALSVIVVQAGAAADVFELDPRRAREPIRAIDAAARSALADLRRVLGILKDEAEYEPQPGLGRLDSLIEQVRSTGLQVSVEIEGAPQPLPAAVDLSAYRIVQEALTNTIKHAGAEHVSVRVRYADELALEIRDDGRSNGNGNGSGSGLIGMRERVAMLGGSVEAGSAAGGGYLVSARIPLGDRR